MSQEILQYAENLTSNEPPILYQLRRETHLKTLYPRMVSGPYQGRLLAMIAQLIQPSSILEIGTYTGYSCICMSEGLRDGGVITSIEMDAELSHLIFPALEKAQIKDRVKIHFGKALDILPTLNDTFDMVFIDADKQNYVSYYQIVLPRVKAGGIILADNVLWHGKVLDEVYQDKESKGLREFNEFVAADEQVEQILLPIRDGLMMIRKKR